MKFKPFFCIAILSAIIIIYSEGCAKTVTPDIIPLSGCAAKAITINLAITPSGTCTPTGSITVNAGGSAGFSFKLNSSGTYQSSPVFNNIGASNYIVFVKDADGCERSATATVASAGVAPFSVTASTVPASNCGGSDGAITINASGSSGFQYKLNNGLYQTLNTFTGLAGSSNTVTVKDLNNCEVSVAADILLNTTPGPKFSAVRSLILANCGASACHTNGGNQGGRNYDVDCNIVAAKARIFQRAVVEGTMPAAGGLSAANKAIITDWINAGGGFHN